MRPDGSGQSSAAPEGRWIRIAVRAAVCAAAGVMAAGFVDWRAGALVAGLAALTYLLLGAVRRTRSGAAASVLRSLRGRGYRVVPDGGGRYVVAGPGGVYLLAGTRRRAAQHGSGEWRIGPVPAERIAERLAGRAARLDRLLGAGEGGSGGAPHLRDDASAGSPAPPESGVVPVILVAGRRPEAVVELGRALLARPRPALRHILGRGDVLTAEQARLIAARIRRRRSSA
ncbi:hypothetical protein [Streptomonospora sp. PA3]|uniref:hypothetical protein n=1 Tax=Streptomonospora sp. PA3 TaxID=2607326 RepID=UPI0031BBB6E3